jgi:hypothetical protein
MGEVLLGNALINPGHLGDALDDVIQALRRDSIETELASQGGIFIGLIHLASLGKISLDQKILLPDLPEWLSVDFLRQSHPVRPNTTVGANLLLAFDRESFRWINIDLDPRGDCLFPGSISKDSQGLMFKEMIQLTKAAKIGERMLAPHDDHRPVARVLELYSELALTNFPFKPGYYGFTWDSEHATVPGAVVAIGRPHQQEELSIIKNQPITQPNEQAGLITGWH